MALELARLAAEAGILNVVTGHGEEAGAALAANPGIATSASPALLRWGPP